MNQKMILLILLTNFFFISSCTNNDKSKEEIQSLKQPQENTIYNVGEFYSVADSLANDTLFVKGVIEHLCRHSDHRFKIIDITGNGELKVETDVNTERPSASDIGKIVIVKGKPVPVKLDLDAVEKMKQNISNNHIGEENTDHYKEEIYMVEKIRQKIATGEIEFYTQYNLEAISYEFQK